jgi:hypothetical protein
MTDRLDSETWKTLMIVLLGVADYVWAGLKSSAEKAFSSIIAERVGFVLFESWVLSNREDPTLWTRMAQLFPGWCHVMSVVVTWKLVSVALTQRMLNLLYGPSEGLPFVKLTIAPKARVDGKFVYYAWSRFLNFLGNLLQSTASPETFLEVFVAVREMVGLFLEVGRESVKMKAKGREDAAQNQDGSGKTSGVNGNTLLQLFGKFIFDAVISNIPARHLGTSMATQIMCEVFVVCSANTNFKRAHLARFYTALSRILLSQEQEVSSTLVAVLRHCGSLFTYGLPGSHILIPSFVFAVSRVLNCKKNVSESIQAYEVRNYALKVLSTLLCLPEHFQSAPLYPVVGRSTPTGVLSVRSYKDLVQFYRELISRTLSMSANEFQEDNSDNINLLLWIHFVHGAQTNKFDSIVTFCNRILSAVGSYSTENVLTALKCISALTNYVQPGLGSKCARMTLDLIARETRNGPTNTDAARVTLTASIYSLCDWVICDRHLIDEKGLLESISSTIMTVLTNEQTPTTREAARYLMVQLINNHGQWPTGNGCLSLSCAITESNVLVGSNTARYFCLEG